MTEREAWKKRVDDAVAMLGEHFDSVHITVTHDMGTGDKEASGTFFYSSGGGNWFARYGSVMHWLKCSDWGDGEDIAVKVRKSAEPE